MEIQRGKIPSKIKAVIYGPEGIGKSTLASHFPAPVFIDVEGGTHELDVARVSVPSSWPAFVQTVEGIRRMDEFATVVIDTADWAEKMLKEQICMENKVQSLGDVPYGVLFQKLGAAWGRLLDSLSSIAKGKHVVILAHSQMSHCEVPEEKGSFDRYELKLNNSFKVNTAAMTKEWASIVLFLNYEIFVSDGKAQGGRRVCYTSHHTCWDAKNRYGLPERLNLPTTGLPPELAKVLNDPEREAKSSGRAVQPSIPMERANAAFCDAQEAAKANQAPAEAVDNNPEPADKNGDGTASANPQASGEGENSPEKTAMLNQLRELMKISGVSMKELDAYMAAAGIVPAGTLPYDYNDDTLRRLIGRWDEVKNTIIERRTK